MGEKKELISLQIQIPEWKRILEQSAIAVENLPKICSSELSQISKVIETYPMRINPYYLSLIKEKDDAIFKEKDVKEAVKMFLDELNLNENISVHLKSKIVKMAKEDFGDDLVE